MLFTKHVSRDPTVRALSADYYYSHDHLSFGFRVTTIELRTFDRCAWNRAASRRGGSMNSEYKFLSSLWLKNPGRSVRHYGIFSIEGAMVGHFSLLRRRGRCWFVDGLRLDPEFQIYWGQAMAAALELLGPGRYAYGWAYSLEPPRRDAIEQIPGVRVTKEEAILVCGVDFADWPSWDGYYRSLSENSRRNAARVLKTFRNVEVREAHGLGTLLIIPRLVKFRAANYARKGLNAPPIRMFFRYVVNALILSKAFRLSYFVADGEVLAVHVNYDFENVTYYLEGAFGAERGGTAWHLQIEVARAAYEADPTGKYIIGYSHFPYNEEADAGLIRSRRAMRVKEWPNHPFEFSYSKATIRDALRVQGGGAAAPAPSPLPAMV